jgi:hypothetical protein
LNTLESAVFDGSGKAKKPVIVNYDGLLQRGQGLQKQCSQACSALTEEVMGVGCEKVNVHQGLLAEISGQLPFLGSRIILGMKDPHPHMDIALSNLSGI